MKPTIQDIIKIQTEQLNRWERVLKPEVFKDLKEWAVKYNDKVVDPFHITRGSDLDNFVLNYPSYRPQQTYEYVNQTK